MTSFNYVSNKEEEDILLQFAMTQAKSNKGLIESLEEFQVEIKKNGEIHKTKEKARLKLIKDLHKENSELKKFFIERNVPEPKDITLHMKRYKEREQVKRGRTHFHKDKDKGMDERILDSSKEVSDDK